MYEFWSALQACVWIASRDDAAVSSLPDNFTFAMLGFHVELELIDSDDDAHAVVIEKGMSFGQLRGLLDIIAEYFGPQQADRPRTAWIESAQKELLAACGHGVLKMAGRSLYGGASGEMPAGAFATFRFFERDGVDCLGPPDLVDADCWRDLRLRADDVRRVWHKDRSAGAGAAPSMPAINQKNLPTGNRPFDDDALVAEIAATVRNAEFPSVRAAVLARKAHIQGYGTEDSKVRRIAEKVRKLLGR